MTADAVGGVWQYATDLARALAPAGVETVIALMGPPPSAAQRATAVAIPGVTLVDTGLELDWLAEDAGTVADAGRGIAALAGDLKADIVQLSMPALAASVRFAMPVVAVAHSCVATWWDAMHGTVLPADFAWRGALVGAGLRAVDRVVAPSAAFAEAVMRVHRLARPPTVVHNGRAPIVLPSAAMHDFAFTAGRLWDKAKNVATLDRAAARLAFPVKAAGPVRGPNGERASFANLVAVGSMGEAGIAACLAARPVFASAARYEPFGLAVLEAAAAGCPLVLSDIPTFRELWDGVAVFVPAEDDRAFAEAIEAIVGDMHVRLMLGDAARARAARYTLAAEAAGMMTIWRDLLRPNRAVHSAAPQVAA
ncbi:glycosyl transferase family 1 [Sphingomonas oleivorans]|uniref:Glycosyl transferase family 1 n=2 Tax=Sphingomonas oleivorans TaxID=1735121 RepID=A0A2T5FUC6_9SPHN|nr:glycosyl transferase family 1 [Sphingomonas oleivorans]